MIFKNKYNKLKNLSLFSFTFLLFSSYLASGQDLQSYITEALQNNPTIQKVVLKHKLMQEKTNEVNTLPNTEFGLGYFVSKPETRVGAQTFKVSAKQMFPWFGTITSRENYANAIAEVAYEDIVIAQRKLIASVSVQYYNLCSLKAKQKIVKEEIVLLKMYEKMALNAVETAKESVVGVLRLQIRLNELREEKEIIFQNILIAQTAFNKLLNKEHNTNIVLRDSLPILEDGLAFKNDELLLNPELIKYEKLYASVTQSERVNKKESMPNIGISLNYIGVNKIQNSSIPLNGRDIVMPMVHVSIPIFNKKHISKTKQHQLEKEQITLEKKERKNVLETLLDKALKARNISKIKYQTYAKNIEQVKSVLQILIKNYETKKIDFDQLLEMQALELRFKINQIEAVNQYYQQTININYLIQ